MVNSTDEYKEKAWELFKDNNPTEDALEYIIDNCSEPYKQRAKDLLNKINKLNNGIRRTN